MLLGDYRHNVDAKGRLFIPAKLREDLGDLFYLLRGPHEGMLYVFPEQSFAELASKIVSIPLNDYDGQEAVRMLLQDAQKVEVDKQGRILINRELREYARLEHEAYIQGMINRCEIWDVKTWENRSAGYKVEGAFAKAFASLQQLGS